MPDELIHIADQIMRRRYPEAAVIILAGSIVRGEGTLFSDLDLVVVYENLPAARRESFYFEGYPVEAFVHDPETLHYFLTELDCRAGIPSLAQMISEGIEIPGPNGISAKLKKLAATIIAAGPPPLGEDERRRMRYNLTNLTDDIRAPRSTDELRATGAELYEAAADFWFRANNQWSAKGKSIPRKLGLADENFGRKFGAAFEDLFAGGRPAGVIALIEEILEPHGGFFFDGHRIEAPAEFRIKLS